jgi:RHS repeat-associated protein
MEVMDFRDHIAKTWVSSALLALSCAALAPSAATAAALVGRTIGASTVSRLGEQTYTIPIMAPPGVKGLAPQISLNYEHRRLERLSGVGWTLGGLSVISRCPKTVAQDGVADLIQGNTSDKFCLDGNRLRLTTVGGTYGAAGTTYRLQIDTVARVTVVGLGPGGDPDYFKVEQKNGLIYEYGHTANSRIESLAVLNLTRAYFWAVNRIYDREGNSINFFYQEDGAPNGDFRIDKIEYTSNGANAAAYRMQFFYDLKPTGDTSQSGQYLGGGILANNKRLSHIDVTHIPTAGTLVRSYVLAYEASLSNTNLSRLHSIQECAGPVATPDCYSATTFTYANGAAGVGAEVPSGTAPIVLLAIDISGDGRTDIVYSSNSTSGTGTWMYQLANSSGGFNAAANTGIANTNYTQAIAFDYNGDGKDDVLVPFSGGTWWAILGSQTGLSAPVNTNLSAANTAAGQSLAMDWNGDGRDDLVWQSSTTSPSINVNLRNASGSAFAATVRVDTPPVLPPLQYSYAFPFSGQNPRSHIRGLDFNGDGIRDFCYVTVTPGGPFPVLNNICMLGGGKGLFQLSTLLLASIVGDFNGDGYSDVAWGFGSSFDFRLSTGVNFGPGVSVPTPTQGNFSLAMVRDWNSDGLDDVLIPVSTTGTWWVYISSGNAFAAGVNTNISTSSLSLSLPIDLNGDGLDDVGYIKSTGQFAVLPHLASTPDLLTGVADGYGNTVAISYATISQAAYTPGTGAVFPNQDFQGPIVVARQVSMSNGIGATHTKTYDYKTAIVNQQSAQSAFAKDGLNRKDIPNPAPARGLRAALKDAGNVNQVQFTGFGTITVTDTIDNLVTATDYSSADPPLTGVATGFRTYQPGGTTPITTVANTWLTFAGTGIDGAYAFPYVQTAAANDYEVGGTFNAALKRTTTTALSNLDAYGTAATTTINVTEPVAGANGVQAGASYTTTTVLSAFQDNVTNWCLGRPGTITTTGLHNQGPSGAAIVRIKNQNWDAAGFCRLSTVNSEITEPGKPQALTRTLGYDGFGNVTSESFAGLKDASTQDTRTTLTEYIVGATEPGRLPVKITNAAGEATTLGWDFAKGVLTSQIDPNNVQTSWQYDVFGRRTREIRAFGSPDKTETGWTYNDCASVAGGCINANNKLVVTATEYDSGVAFISDSSTYFDKMDRVLRTQTRQLDGSYDRNDRDYNAQGLLLRSAAPCAAATCAYFWTNFLYDAVGRVTQFTRPVSATDATAQSTSISYEGLSMRVTDALGKNKIAIENAVGAVVRSVDHNGYFQQFDFDAFGSPVKVQDGTGSLIANTLLDVAYVYGAEAFRTQTTDMDMGTWSYTPNAFGETYQWTDAKLINFEATFDKLSRPLTRIDAKGTPSEGLTSWFWGTQATAATAHNAGQLEHITSPGYLESRAYDGTARLINRHIVTDVPSGYDYAYTYNNKGFLDTVTYPTSTASYSLKLQYLYSTASGMLEKIKDFNSATVFWQANAMNPRGQVTRETLGNGLITNRAFDAVTGWVNNIQTGTAGNATSIQNESYLIDKVGNVTQRQNNALGLTENFFYDNVYRLDHSTLGAVTNLQFTYDAMGNILSRSDVAGGAQWTYDGAKKHFVTQAGDASHTYTPDANGNAATRNGQTITWTSYNYPSVINGNGKVLNFSYDAFRQRYSQDYNSNGVHEITQYVGDLLEKVTSGGVIDWRHYIKVGDRTIAIMSRQNPGTNTTRYILPDDQGSISKITNSAGTTDVSENFSPCGARRDPNTWSGSASCPDLVTIKGISREGFNGQDAIGGVSMGLNHMNGRVEDAITGRFLSADPYVAEPGFTQAWNRYSYVYNNPMSFTDPSGFFRLCFQAVFSRPDFGGGFGGEGGFGDGGFGGGDSLVVIAFCVDFPDQVLLPPPNLDTSTYQPPNNDTPRSAPTTRDTGIYDPPLQPVCLECYLIGAGSFVKGLVSVGKIIAGRGVVTDVADVTAAGARAANIAAKTTAKEFQSNLLSNGYKVVKQTVGPNGPVSILSNGQKTYAIYTATSTGAASAQVINAAGQTIMKIRLTGP